MFKRIISDKKTIENTLPVILNDSTEEDFEPEKAWELWTQQDPDDSTMWQLHSLKEVELNIAFNVLFILLFLSLFAVVLGVIIYSNFYRLYGIALGAVIWVMIAWNVFSIKRHVDFLKLYKRYQGFWPYLKGKSAVLVEDLAKEVSLSQDKLLKDIDTLYKYGFLPHAKIVYSNQVLFLNEQAYKKYIKNQTAMDSWLQEYLTNKHRIENRAPQVKQLLDDGNSFLLLLDQKRKDAYNAEYIYQLNTMENYVRQILDEVDKKPELLDNVSLFSTYYLPDTTKLLNEQDELLNRKVTGNNQKITLTEITEHLDERNIALNKLLNWIYQDEEEDVLADMDAFSEIDMVNDK
jgi:hypothetical protein